MIDLIEEARSLFIRDGYDVASPAPAPRRTLCFEDDRLFGAIYIFDTAAELLESWQSTQDTFLRSLALPIRRTGEKAWNIYSIFLTSGECDRTTLFRIMNIDEDLADTRKIARARVTTTDLLEYSLLPLLSLQTDALIANEDNTAVLAERLREDDVFGLSDALISDRFDLSQVVTTILDERSAT